MKHITLETPEGGVIEFDHHGTDEALERTVKRLKAEMKVSPIKDYGRSPGRAIKPSHRFTDAMIKDCTAYFAKLVESQVPYKERYRLVAVKFSITVWRARLLIRACKKYGG